MEVMVLSLPEAELRVGVRPLHPLHHAVRWGRRTVVHIGQVVGNPVQAAHKEFWRRGSLVFRQRENLCRDAFWREAGADFGQPGVQFVCLLPGVLERKEHDGALRQKNLSKACQPFERVPLHVPLLHLSDYKVSVGDAEDIHLPPGTVRAVAKKLKAGRKDEETMGVRGNRGEGVQNAENALRDACLCQGVQGVAPLLGCAKKVLGSAADAGEVLLQFVDVAPGRESASRASGLNTEAENSDRQEIVESPAHLVVGQWGQTVRLNDSIPLGIDQRIVWRLFLKAGAHLHAVL